LKEASTNKLFNDVCGIKKKLKLKELKNPSKDEVALWIENAQKVE
jgi:lysyl-tRNA synthetase class 2